MTEVIGSKGGSYITGVDPMTAEVVVHCLLHQSNELLSSGSVQAAHCFSEHPPIQYKQTRKSGQ